MSWTHTLRSPAPSPRPPTSYHIPPRMRVGGGVRETSEAITGYMAITNHAALPTVLQANIQASARQARQARGRERAGAARASGAHARARTHPCRQGGGWARAPKSAPLSFTRMSEGLFLHAARLARAQTHACTCVCTHTRVCARAWGRAAMSLLSVSVSVACVRA